MCFYCGKTSLKAHLINLDLVITNVLKYFFGYPKFHSVTAILLELSLPSFCTLVYIIVNIGFVSNDHLH